MRGGRSGRGRGRALERGDNGQRYAHPILECPECPVVLDTALVPFVIDNGVNSKLVKGCSVIHPLHNGCPAKEEG